MSTQKITVDGIPLEVSDTAAAVINKLVAQVKDLTSSLTMANDSLAKAVTPEVHAKVVADLDAARKDVMTPAARDAMVTTWVALLTDAKRLAPNVTTDGKTCHAIRKEALTAVTADAGTKAAVDAVLGGVAIDAAGEDLIATAWRVALAAGLTAAATDANHVGDAMLGNKQPGAAPAASKPIGRNAFMTNMKNGA